MTKLIMNWSKIVGNGLTAACSALGGIGIANSLASGSINLDTALILAVASFTIQAVATTAKELKEYGKLIDYEQSAAYKKCKRSIHDSARSASLSDIFIL